MSRRPPAIPHRGFMSRLVASFQTQDDMAISRANGTTAISVSTQHLHDLSPWVSLSMQQKPPENSSEHDTTDENERYDPESPPLDARAAR
jgi:hypothetical protein